MAGAAPAPALPPAPPAGVGGAMSAAPDTEGGAGGGAMGRGADVACCRPGSGEVLGMPGTLLAADDAGRDGPPALAPVAAEAGEGGRDPLAAVRPPLVVRRLTCSVSCLQRGSVRSSADIPSDMPHRQ
jgi:hypothetical protein